MEITYESLQPILLSETIEGNLLKCTFRANNQLGYLKAQFILLNEDVAEPELVKRKGLFAFPGAQGASGPQNVFHANNDKITVTGRNISVEEFQKGVINAFKNIQSFYIYKNGTWEYHDQD
ncbi:MAG TPA: hypothetical protein VD905_04810 [Flavobacteriales bacterium]|nr:hypothetical protein [Flavobacteriales bacterium]